MSSSSNVGGSRRLSNTVISLIRMKSSIVKLDRNKRSTLFTFGLGSSAADAPSALSDDDDKDAGAAEVALALAAVDEAFAAGDGGTCA